jgi:hypothetical protein
VTSANEFISCEDLGYDSEEECDVLGFAGYVTTAGIDRDLPATA